MSKINNENYILIQGWMVNELNLKGNELLVYAIIYGFSQAENQLYNGSLQYLADWTNSTKQGVMKNLKSLVNKGYIGKIDKLINGIKFCEYYATKFNGVVNKVEHGMQQSLMGGMQQSLPNNNNIYNNINNNNNIYDFLQKELGRTLSPTEIEKVKEWEDNELTRYAVKVAILNGAYTINYIDTIIYNWQKLGIKSISQAQEETKRYRDKKISKKTNYMPEWFDVDVKKKEVEINENNEMENLLKDFK